MRCRGWCRCCARRVGVVSAPGRPSASPAAGSLGRLHALLWLLAAGAAVLCTRPGVTSGAAPPFTQSAEEIAPYELVEIAYRPPHGVTGNPFSASFTGEFQPEGGSPVAVEGFCDAPDGSVYRVRFMASRPGRHFYTVSFRNGSRHYTHSGSFAVRASTRRGPVRVDPEHPWHFVWEGTGEHYFWNGTTAYWLAGWDDDTIRLSLDRLRRLGVNRVRVALLGRVKDGRAWSEDVFPTERFSFLLAPWAAARPGSVEDPGFDVQRFDVDHWKKFDRLLHHARERGINISIVFYVDGARRGVDPFGPERMGGDDEQRFYRYAVARFAAYPNVMWDLANEYRAFRTDGWAQAMGTLMKRWDPYDHLTSTHGFGDFRFRTAAWADFAMYQQWDECGGHRFMLNNRIIQAATGRPIPQVNEEYGYEDHYPTWGCGGRTPPRRSADTRRRLAWEITMAGGYQTTGERANRGTGSGPDSGGGWINGRGDDEMVMLVGYANLVQFFTGLEWWKLEPHDELVGPWHYCLAEPGRQYVVYSPDGAGVFVSLHAGTYRAEWFNPRTGDRVAIHDVLQGGGVWKSPAPPDEDGDWAVAIRRTEH